jgi:hypothetical protein
VQTNQNITGKSKKFTAVSWPSVNVGLCLWECFDVYISRLNYWEQLTADKQECNMFIHIDNELKSLYCMWDMYLNGSGASAPHIQCHTHNRCS